MGHMPIRTSQAFIDVNRPLSIPFASARLATHGHLHTADFFSGSSRQVATQSKSTYDGTWLTPPIDEHSYGMERTASGRAIVPNPKHELVQDENAMSEDEAVRQFKAHFRRRRRDRRYERQDRLLRRLVHSQDPLDSEDLRSVLRAANNVFFHGALTDRVGWDWSLPNQRKYEKELVGTTALRKAVQGGYETLVILSRPLLRNRAFHRKLLMSTFLHELIHCYLFISCGFEARKCGGHTPGFRAIAKLLDEWAGPGVLQLCEVRANLEDFRVDQDADGPAYVRWPMLDSHRQVPSAHPQSSLPPLSTSYESYECGVTRSRQCILWPQRP
jgi:hypothetical protein